MKRKNMAVRLIRKSARGFRVGEWLHLFGCDTGDLYGLLHGSFEITEIKNQSDTGVTFILCAFVEGQSSLRPNQGHFMVEFARGQLLYRIAGRPLPFIIQEPEEIL